MLVRYSLSAVYILKSIYLRSNTRLRPCCIAALVLALSISHLSATCLYLNPESSISSQYPILTKTPLNSHYKSENNEIELEGSSDSSSELFKVSNISVTPEDSWLPSTLIRTETVVDNLCQLNVIVRQINSQTNKTENVFVCEHVNRDVYKDIVYNNRKKRKTTSIHRYQFTNSDPAAVFPVLNLTCSHFDCSNITVFNISGQQIDDDETLAMWINSWPLLEVLDLRSTAVKSVEHLLMNASQTSITHMYLDNNDISSLNFTFLIERMPKLKNFSAVNNKIYDIYCHVDLRSRLTSQLQALRLAGNSINCNKSQLWILRQFLSQSSKFPDHDLIKCSTPEKLVDMTWNQRISVLETRICDDCDCRSLKRTAISVDCHNKNLTALPDILPLNTKVLNLTSNRIDSLGVPRNSKNWENVTYVYLENNLISSFQPLGINSEFMRNLAALDIRRNRFQEFPSHIFEQFINLDQVHLSNNPWLCDCESTFAFQEWLQRQFHKVGDKEEIRCGISGSDINGLKSINLEQRLSSRVIYRLSKSELCPPDGLEEPWDWLDAVNWGLGALIVLILVKLALDYIYQHKTKRLPHFFRLNF